MKSTSVIRPFLSFVLMLLFTISITPQQTLHDIFGCHADITTTTDAHQQQVNTHKLSCSCNQADLHAPFTAPNILLTKLITTPAITPVVHYDFPVCKQSTLYRALRGPPAALAC